MSKIQRKDTEIGTMVGPYAMSLRNPALGDVTWFTSYCMGPYKENEKINFEQVSFLAPLLKLRWVKTINHNTLDPEKFSIFFRLIVQIEYNDSFFVPIFYSENKNEVIRPDIKVSYLGSSIMITIGLITYKDTTITKPKKPKIYPKTKLTKYSKFTFDFDPSMSEMIKGSSIYVSCIYGDPEESTISKVTVEDVDEF